MNIALLAALAGLSGQIQRKIPLLRRFIPRRFPRPPPRHAPNLLPLPLIASIIGMFPCSICRASKQFGPDAGTGGEVEREASPRRTDRGRMVRLRPWKRNQHSRRVRLPRAALRTAHERTKTTCAERPAAANPMGMAVGRFRPKSMKRRPHERGAGGASRPNVNFQEEN